MTRGRDIGMLIAWIVICQLAGALGAIFTASSVETWYAALAKPDWTPPSWLFAPVWITLYFFMGIATWLIWRTGKTRNADLRIDVAPRRRAALTAFIIQLILNALWSPIFFGLRAPGAALIDILLLLTALAITIALFWRVSRSAAALLIPYLAWVAFAAALNFSIWRLNA